MTRLSWLLGTMTAALAALPLGCGGDDFTATGGNGGTQTTTSSGGQGGAGGMTATGGSGGTTASGGATTGGTGGAGGATGGSGGAPVCQPIAEPCAECAYATCQDLYCACYAEADCAALVACISPCDPADTVCQQPCLTDHKDSISKAFLLGDCAAGSCSGSCMGVAAIPPCPKCLFTMCPAEMNNCLSDPDCNDIIQCAGNCAPGDLQCGLACANGKPQTATTKALAVQSCVGNANKCQPACGG